MKISSISMWEVLLCLQSLDNQSLHPELSHWISSPCHKKWMATGKKERLQLRVQNAGSVKTAVSVKVQQITPMQQQHPILWSPHIVKMRFACFQNLGDVAASSQNSHILNPFQPYKKPYLLKRMKEVSTHCYKVQPPETQISLKEKTVPFTS